MMLNAQKGNLLGKADPMITHQTKRVSKVNVRTSRLKIKYKHRSRQIARKNTLIRNK